MRQEGAIEVCLISFGIYPANVETVGVAKVGAGENGFGEVGVGEVGIGEAGAADRGEVGGEVLDHLIAGVSGDRSFRDVFGKDDYARAEDDYADRAFE